MMTLDANLILIRVLSSQNHIPFSMQAFSHSCLPLNQIFFVHVIIFYKVARANVKHHILNKHLLHFIVFLIKVCGPKICDDCGIQQPTLFLPCCCEWFPSTTIIFSITCIYFFNKQLGMCKINMGLHGNVPIDFGILNQHFFQKKLWAKTLPTALFDLQIT